MANMITDDTGTPKPQYEKSDGSAFEAWKGKNGHGNVRANDGEIATLGSTSDTSSTNTVIGKLTKVLENLPTTIPGPDILPDMKVIVVTPLFTGSDPSICPVECADLGYFTDTEEDPSVIGLLKKIVALLDTKMEYFGATTTERPDADDVPVGATFKAVQTQETWQSDGTTWVAVSVNDV